MTNISLLLVALLTAVLQQQLLAVAGSAFHKELPRKQSAIHQHRHQHFVSDTKTNQQHQQHHHRGHLRQQQHHQQQSATWQQQFKLNNAMSTEPTAITTKTTTTIHRNQHLQHHQQQQHQEHYSSKLFAAVAAAADVAHTTYATHTAFGKGQRQALLTSTEASTLSTDVSAFSLKNAASAAYQLKSSSSSSSSSSSAKSSQQLADANRAQNYKSFVPSNSVVVDDRLRLKSMESLDYADDYYYDDDDDDDEDEEDNQSNSNNNNNNKHNDNNNNDDDVYVENDDSDNADRHHISASSSSSFSSAARVVRAHHLSHLAASGKTSNLAGRLDHQASKPAPSLLSSEPSQYLDQEQQLLASDQDYADDEPYRSSAENYLGDGHGALTEQKFRELGTLEAVQQTREKILHEQENMRQKTPGELAREHMDRMKTAGRCSRPLPRVIHVSNETSKRYVPYCTILHRCGEDSGCCDSTRQVCAAKSFEDVPVYFFVIKVNSRSNKRDTEVLMLRNHTECHCVNRSNLTTSLQYMSRDKRSDFSRRRYHQQSQQLRNYQDDSLLEQLDATLNMICRCPKHFDVFPEDVPNAERHSSDTSQALRCRCDCLSHNLPCRRLQHGEEGFAVDERKCIAERICKAPDCLHGDYSHQTGRCPRRKNNKRTVTRYDYGYG